MGQSGKCQTEAGKSWEGEAWSLFQVVHHCQVLDHESSRTARDQEASFAGALSAHHGDNICQFNLYCK